MSGGAGGEDGVASVAGCLAVVALLAVTVSIGQIGVVIVVRHRAQSAADLSALAAAGALDGGVAAGCARAGTIAGHAGFRLLECAVVDWDVTVTVESEVSLATFGSRRVRASARAGPAGPYGPE
ncbi:Rv3654c family TadE-like protein [Nocardia sp. alder85J]|uniref:Rv3654c family TadE-like protein n=1 Tax=Nocardia sp. alder85J TaxID=2862949 RepID=UPI001CD25F06|nr:Rv3654c family TadE-like protein [Nocardia sp. alder85J]MCX4093624.1 flp pilus-assembly TadE/G-like family protein [Nocardia sp. alder85J]